MMQALLRSACTWWCHARVWAGNIHLHPVLTVAIQALKTAASLPASALLRAAVGAHAASLRLEASWSALGDLWVRPVAGADSRAISAAEKASANTAIVAVANSTPVPPAGSFDPASPAGAHALRVCARVQALAAVRVSRNDCDGFDSADIEASSSAAWQAWMHSLSSDDRTSLRIWRGGAVRTPTRRHFRAGGDMKLCACPFCGHARASARHFWQECPRLDAMRHELEVEYGILPAWWGAQPSCTSKSGWVTTRAHESPIQRARMQIAACRLGIAIIGLDPVSALPPAAAAAGTPSLGIGLPLVRRRISCKRAPLSNSGYFFYFCSRFLNLSPTHISKSVVNPK